MDGKLKNKIHLLLRDIFFLRDSFCLLQQLRHKHESYTKIKYKRTDVGTEIMKCTINAKST